MSMNSILPQTALLYSENGVCRGISIFLILLGEAVLTCTHNLYFEQEC